MGIRIGQEMPLMKKLEILTDAAKYDVACTSSGSQRSGPAGKDSASGLLGFWKL